MFCISPVKTSESCKWCWLASVVLFTLQNEVNAIKWDPQGNLLASCSDDMTLKVLLPLSTLPVILFVVLHGAPHKRGSNNCCQIFIIICLWYSGFLTLTEILSVHSCCLLSWLLFRLFSYSSLSVFIFWLETDIGQSLPIPMNFSHNHPPVWLGGRVVRTLDLQSVGREFESWPVWYRV